MKDNFPLKKLDFNALFIVSDLHLGDGGRRDNFHYFKNKTPFLEFCDFVKETKRSHLIILGDLIDMWQFNFSKVVYKNFELLKKLSSLNPTYVVGNHEIDLKYFCELKIFSFKLFDNLSFPFYLKINKKKVLFLHGHELDRYNSPENPGWGRVFNIIAGLIEDKHKRPVIKKGVLIEERLEEWLSKLEVQASAVKYLKKLLPVFKRRYFKFLTPLQNPLKAKNHRRLMRKLKTQLVCGHTHRAGFYKNWYFNTGCWNYNKNTFIKIYPDGQIFLVLWKGKEIILESSTLSS